MIPDSLSFGGMTYARVPPESAAIVPGSICRMKIDTELPDWHFMSRSDPANPRYTGLNWSPHTMRLNGGKSAIRLPTPWQEFVMSINTAEAFKYLKRPGSGWVNKPEWPTVQELTFPAPFNLVEVEAVMNDQIFIRYYDVTQAPPSIADFPDPYRVHDFAVIDPAGNVLRPDTSSVHVPVRLPLVSDAPLWIERRKLVLIQSPN